MTNPFFLEEQRKGIKPTTGNPFFDEEFPHAAKDYDSMAWGLGKAALSGLISPLTLLAHTGKKLESMIGVETEFTHMANFLDKATPNLDPALGQTPIQYSPGQMTTPEGILGTTDVAASQVGGALAFHGIGGALDVAASKLPSTVTSRASTAITKMAEGITLKAKQLGASEGVAEGIGRTAGLLPRNVATGMTLDALTNPDQSKQGIAQNALLTAGLTAMEGALYKKVPSTLIPSIVDDPTLVSKVRVDNGNDPDYLQRIKSRIGGVPERSSSIPNADNIYFKIANRNRPFTKMEGQLAKKGIEIETANKPSAISQAANGTGQYINQFNNQPFAFSEDLTPVPQMGPDGKPIEGLKSIFAPIGDNAEKLKTLDAYILAKAVTDQADLGTYREKYRHPTTKEDATIIGTVGGEHHIDYPNETTTHPDLESAQADVKGNGYNKISTSPMPNPNKVTSGISIKDALKSIKDIEQNYPDVAQAHGKLMQYTGAVRNFAQSTGLLTDRGMRMFELLQQNHVSFQSLLDGRIVSPSYSAIENTGITIKAGINNLIKDRILTLAEDHPNEMTDWVRTNKIPDATQTPMWQQVNKVVDRLKNLGLDYATDQEGILELVTKMGPDVITPVDNNWSNVYSYKNGYIQHYSVNKDLGQALQAINPAHIDLFSKIMGFPARALSIGTVENPAFGIIHMIRDSYNATLNSQYGFRLGIDSWRGLKEAFGKGEYGGKMNAERLASGGGYSTLVDARDLLSNDKLTYSVLPHTASDKALHAIKHPVELLANMTRPFLEAARIGEYMKAREAGATAFEAAIHSRSFLGDFGMKGAAPAAQNFAYMTAFMNPGMQSLDAEIKAIGNHPVGYAAKGMASIGLFTVLNYAYNYLQGDNDISQVRQTPEGSTYWYTKLPGGKIFKTPKPFGPGQLFGTLLETALDKVRRQNPDGFTQWAKSLAESAEFSIFPNVAVTATNLYANRDNFSGRPIIPSNLEGIDPQYQQTPSTSNVSKAITNTVRTATLGKVNISPITMDYILRSVLGTGGQAAEYASGNIGGVKRDITETPYLSRFFAKYPSYATQPIEEFYSKAKEMDEVVRTTNHLYKTNQIANFTKYINENADKMSVAPVYAETKAQLNELRTALVSIENDPYISADSKKEMRDYILTQTISITDNVNKAVRKILN